jgi:hypothetical protein
MLGEIYFLSKHQEFYKQDKYLGYTLTKDYTCSVCMAA